MCVACTTNSLSHSALLEAERLDDRLDNKACAFCEDVIDVSDVLVGYDPLSDSIFDFVRSTYNATERATYLQIDADGSTNGASFLAVARVDGILNQDLSILVANGHLVLA